MRHFYCNLTPRVIHHHAREALSGCLDWKPFRQSVTVTALLDVLLLMGATTASLFATVRRFFSFSHETAARAIKANLPDEDGLVAGLVGALHDVLGFSRLDRRRHWLLGNDPVSRQAVCPPGGRCARRVQDVSPGSGAGARAARGELAHPAR